MRAFLSYGSTAATFAVGMLTVLGWFGEAGWLLDLFAHFRLQYFVVALAAALVAHSAKSSVLAVWGYTIAGANLVSLLPLYLSPDVELVNEPPLTLLSYNVEALTTDPPYDEVVEYIRSMDPALLLILEANSAWVRRLASLEPRYRTAAAFPVDTTTSGMLLMTRVPLKRVTFRADIGVPAPAIEITLDNAGKHYRILGLHTLPPIKPIYAKARDDSIAAAAAWVDEDPIRTIVIGDFNATPWSSAFSSLRWVGLVNSQRGFGYGASWPHRPPWLAPFAIPIDHALTTPDLTTVRRELGPPFRSDHRTLFVGIAEVKR